MLLATLDTLGATPSEGLHWQSGTISKTTIHGFASAPHFTDVTASNDCAQPTNGSPQLNSRHTFDLCCYLTSDLLVSGFGQLWLDDRLITSPDLMPEYWRERVFEQPKFMHPNFCSTLPIRIIEKPCICALGWGWNNYGHFLVEMLPRLLFARSWMARLNAPEADVLFRSDTPSWLLSICEKHLGIGRDKMIFFNATTERVKLMRGIFPTYLYRGFGFHPRLNFLLAELRSLAAAPLEREGNFFVSRQNVNVQGFKRHCRNENELAAIAESEFDCKIICPENMSWREQVRLFRRARLMCGLYGSGLHTALLADQKLQLAIVGSGNSTQTHIAQLRGQKISFLVNGWNRSKSFSIDLDEFRKFMGIILRQLNEPAPIE